MAGFFHLLVEAHATVEAVPLLDELAGDWQNISTLRSLPALASACGAAQAAPDILAVNHLSFPPLTVAGNTGTLSINGSKPAFEQTRWLPYEVERAGYEGAIGVQTSVRLVYEKPGLLFHVTLANRADTPQPAEVKIGLVASALRHQRWGWLIPRDARGNEFAAVVSPTGLSLTVNNARGQTSSCFAFARKPNRIIGNGDSGVAIWQLTLPPHGSVSLDYVLVFGERENAVSELALDWAKHFDTVFAKIKSDWQERFDAMFTPGNAYFSGNLPRLVTSDEKLRRVYYLSAFSALSSCRTSYPVAPRVYVSNAPEYNNVMVYFWDTREWATTLALLDPAMLKQYLRGWLATGIYKGYAQEFLTGSLQGPWYSANDFSVLFQLDAYLNVTGDRAFLSEVVNGKTVLEHMDAIATHWKQLVRPGRILADYGQAENLLECVPTYIHEVPAFNAANVWMMRRVADIEEARNQPTRAAQLRAEAARLLPAVLDLYEPGQGVWDSLHRDGKRVEMRHVFDFATIGLTIKEDLTPQIRSEMVAFVERELITDHWMRAQSLTDPAATNSDRPDHGPMGAFSSWPAETLAVMIEFGEYAKALDFLRRTAAVTDEGPFSQSRELMGRTSNSRTRIASRGQQTYHVSSGAAFAETIIREFFGYQPDLLQKKLAPPPAARRFEGELLNVRQGEFLWNIRVKDHSQTFERAK